MSARACRCAREPLLAAVVEDLNVAVPGVSRADHRGFMLAVELLVVDPNRLLGLLVDHEYRVQVAGTDQDVPRSKALIPLVIPGIRGELLDRVQMRDVFRVFRRVREIVGQILLSLPLPYDLATRSDLQ